MDAESFFARWSKRKAQTDVKRDADTRSDTQLPAGNVRKTLPTVEDVAALTPDSDFSPFVARGVDETVRRSALKKLFSDPRFNVMDGLDVYIEDYNKSKPLSAAVLAALNHARSLLNPQEQAGNPLMRLLEQDAAAESEPRSEDAAQDGEANINPGQDADDNQV
ncbi:MAG: DUF3306 domain-containing protein [Noviherbaspirillum sp.]